MYQQSETQRGDSTIIYDISPQHQQEVQRLQTVCLRIALSSHPVVHGLHIFLRQKEKWCPCFCIDYWHLNEVTRKDAYPLPWINNILNTLAGSRSLGLAE